MPNGNSAQDPALAALAHELKTELHALKDGVPGACRRFEDAAFRAVVRFGEQGMSAERILGCVQQMIYGHVPWEPFRDPSHMDRLAVPIITACIASYRSERA